MGLNRTALSALDTRGRIAERAHLISLIAALPLAALAAVLGRPGFALVLLVPNLMFHGYPVLLQRYTRARLRAISVARQWSSENACPISYLRRG